jgi:hypothetical protein
MPSQCLAADRVAASGPPLDQLGGVQISAGRGCCHAGIEFGFHVGWRQMD